MRRWNLFGSFTNSALEGNRERDILRIFEEFWMSERKFGRSQVSVVDTGTWREDIHFSGLCGLGGDEIGLGSYRIALVMYFVEDEQIARNLQRSLNSYEDERMESNDKENFTLTDPRLEYHDPTPSIHELFVRLDRRYFWGQLGMVEVKWSRRMTRCAGMCYYQGRRGLCSIKLSAPLLSLRPRKDLVETLLHEMIHAYLFVTEAKADREDHGPNFRKHMRRINQEAGTDITIYHEFHDEVAYYQKHIWRCTGICRDRRPFFGFVRRTMNRAPGPYDRWWKEHQITCGGHFIKVSEPQKQCKKKVKHEKDKTTKKVSGTRSILDFWRSGSSEVLPATSFKVNSPDTPDVEIIRVIGDFGKRSERGTPDRAHVIKPRTDNDRPGALDEDSKNEYLSVRATVRNAWANKYLSPSTEEQKPRDPESRSPVTNQMKRREISCPVCSENFSETIINEHVEECLSKVKCVEIVNDTVREKETKKGGPQRLGEDNSNGKLVPCPVCRKVLLGKNLNEHLESCLNFSFEDADIAQDECERVPCPCCLEWVLEKSINEHVSDCLAIVVGDSSKCD